MLTISDIIVILLFFISRFIPASFILELLHSYIQISELDFRLVVDGVFIIIFFITLRSKSKIKYRIMGWNAPYPLDFVWGLTGSLILFIFSMGIIKITPQFQIYDTFLLISPLKIYFFLIFASCTEELVYRAYLLRLLTSSFKYSSVYAVLISSVIFSLGHMYMGVGGIIFSFVAGIFLSYLLLRFNSITVPILSHSAYNVLMFTLFRFESSI